MTNDYDQREMKRQTNESVDSSENEFMFNNSNKLDC